MWGDGKSHLRVSPRSSSTPVSSASSLCCAKATCGQLGGVHPPGLVSALAEPNKAPGGCITLTQIPKDHRLTYKGTTTPPGLPTCPEFQEHTPLSQSCLTSPEHDSPGIFWEALMLDLPLEVLAQCVALGRARPGCEDRRSWGRCERSKPGSWTKLQA